MDLTYLLQRRQISLFHAGTAVDASARRAHDGLARLYGKAIAELHLGGAGVPGARRDERVLPEPATK